MAMIWNHNISLLLVALLSLQLASQATRPIKTLDGKILRGHVTVWSTDLDKASGEPDGTKDPPARACLASARAKDCIDATAGKRSFPYLASIKPFTGSASVNLPSLFLFSAKTETDLSRQLHVLKLLGVNSDAKLLDIVDEVVVLSEQSQYSLSLRPKLSKWPVLQTADYIMVKGESHLGSHRYSIRTYVFSLLRQRYVLLDEYETKKKYPGLDQVEDLRVLEGERETSERRVLGKMVT